MRNVFKGLLLVVGLCAVVHSHPASAQEHQFVGEIRLFAGDYAPEGWALCDGQLLAISGNDALFSVLGMTYGGDGRTNFALPDLRGRVALHPGEGPGLTRRRLGDRAGQEATDLQTIGVRQGTDGAARTGRVGTMPPYTGINFIIALTGRFPARQGTQPPAANETAVTVPVTGYAPVTKPLAPTQECSQASKALCARVDATCDVVRGTDGSSSDLCRWASVSKSWGCSYTAGLWTPADSKYARQHPGAVPPGSAGACITEAANVRRSIQ